MDAALAALAGAAIGALGTLGTTWLQQRHQTRRDLLKSAAELGMRDFEHTFDRIKATGGSLPPISTFVAYHAEVLQALAANDFGPEAVARIDAKQKATVEAIKNRNAPKS